MSETPRTDKAFGSNDWGRVLYEARELERELHQANEKIKALEEDGKMLDWIEKCRTGEIEPPSDYPITTMHLRQAIRNAMEKGQQ